MKIAVKFIAENILNIDADEACDWLDNEIGTDNWDYIVRYESDPQYSAFMFNTEEDAIMFKLKFNV